MDFMVRKLIFDEQFKGRLISDASRTQYVNPDKTYYKMFKAVGLTPVDVAAKYDQGRGVKADVVANWYKDSNTLVVIDSTTQMHLVNQWKDCPGLKNEMLSPSFMTIDEFHETLQSRMAAIVSEGARLFDRNNPADAKMLAKAEIIHKAFEALASRVALNETQFREMQKKNGNVAALVDVRSNTLMMTAEFAKALIAEGKRLGGTIEINADATGGKDSHMVRQALLVRGMEKTARFKRIPHSVIHGCRCLSH
jgi:hypothetical protein